ncbi:MAG: hypothetical protein JOZ24_10935 [Candidatus Eremiobacteraeota bacterium]|nr:hypothetical protein [Candidatus Eremiobacteraeota bacterium]
MPGPASPIRKSPAEAEAARARALAGDEQPRGFDPNTPIVCTVCGTEGPPLHLGCTLCEDCCDCRP